MPSRLQIEARTLIVDVCIVVFVALLYIVLSPEAWVSFFVLVNMIVLVILLGIAVLAALALREQGKQFLFTSCVATGLGIFMFAVGLAYFLLLGPSD